MSEQSEETKTIFPAETSKARLLFVVVPDDAKDFRIQHWNVSVFVCSQQDPEPDLWYELSPGDWQTLGDLNEVTEEQAARVVDTYFDEFERDTYFVGQDEGYMIFVYTAIHALKSLARSLSIPADKKTIVLADFKK